jgi:hypothetical protein
VLPLLYLHGLSSGDFGPALTQFLGSGAGLSAATITRLTGQWQDDAAAFNKRSLKDTDFVYCWVDGIHLKVRLEQDKVCLLVMIGVRADGTKELIALDDGFRESSESWADLLRSKSRSVLSGVQRPATRCSRMRLCAEEKHIETELAPSQGLGPVARAEPSPVLGGDGQVQSVPTTQGQLRMARRRRRLSEGQRAHLHNLEHVLLKHPVRLLGPVAIGGGESPGSFLQ